jgi:hypothetical protein
MYNLKPYAGRLREQPPYALHGGMEKKYTPTAYSGTPLDKGDCHWIPPDVPD